MTSTSFPHPNQWLVGHQNAREQLATPALIIELPILQRNLQQMAAFAQTRGVQLRPHAKTHKCSQIAKLQRSAGAIGICVAKLGEAEILSALGQTEILITSPIVTVSGLRRLANLNAMKPSPILIVADHPDSIQGLSRAAIASGQVLRVLVDLDIGLHRTGIGPGQAALDLARLIADAPGLEFCGIQAYAGHLQHVATFAERREKALRALEGLNQTLRLLDRDGMPYSIVSGSGTGTFGIDVEAGLFTELQVGSYMFMDREYHDVEGIAPDTLRFETSLFVDSSVISANTPGLVTTDAGLKAFATEAGPPPIHSGAPTGASYFFFGDEQGGILFAQKLDALPLGARVRCVTPHCDPTVNLYSHYHVMDGDALIALWPIETRGAHWS